MNFSLTSIILLVSSLNALMFFFISLKKGKDERTGYLIHLLLLLCSFVLFDEFTRWTYEFFSKYPEYTFITSFAWFLIVPTIYLFIRSLVGRLYFKWYDILHLLPLIAKNTLGVNHLTLTREMKLNILTGVFSEPESNISKLLFALQIIVYLYLIYKLLIHKYNYSGIDLIKRMSTWLKVIYFLLIFYLISIILIIFCLEFTNYHLRQLDISKTFIFLFVVYGWLFYALYKPKSLNNPIKSIRIWMDKYNLNNLSPELSLIIDSIKNKELFLKEGIQTSQIASTLNISGRYLTNLVNMELNISTTQLINLLRILELENRVKNQNYSIYSLEGLAKSVGFKSKSSFYRSFKTFTGQTPAQYFEKIIQ